MLVQERGKEKSNGQWSILSQLLDCPVVLLGTSMCFLMHMRREGASLKKVLVRRSSEVLQDNSLVDIDFVGPKFTWCRMINGRARLCERLDRAVASTK